MVTQYIGISFLIYTFMSPLSHAATAFRLDCPERTWMIVTHFKYGLTTLKWAEHHFQVASGFKHNKTSGGSPYRVTSFRNGDDLVYFPQNKTYFFLYADREKPVICEKTKSFTTHAILLPRYHRD
ncbi:hypothetical protein [Serratia liquefaciens]|uniref:hypothetical protein n=1 Tax=Serratia liquefaciens TaxID=614 RepID=UPI002178B5D2|nr:hypothetical protein [Serratia liquefaciens]CAI1018239.1 Uncharacterised protein [Serratia liquefaciens]